MPGLLLADLPDFKDFTELSTLQLSTYAKPFAKLENKNTFRFNFLPFQASFCLGNYLYRLFIGGFSNFTFSSMVSKLESLSLVG